MSAVETDKPANGEQASSLTKLQKLAILLVMLGAESAAEILKHFEPKEVETICEEMTKFTMISQEMQLSVLKDFGEVAVEAGTSVLGGAQFTRVVLEKALGTIKASEFMGKVEPLRAPVASMQVIMNMEPRQIFNLVRHEQPQAVALVLSYVGAEKAAEVLNFFHNEQRDKVLERIATMAPTPITVVEKVVEVLVAKGGGQSSPLQQTGGVKTAADVLNAMDRSVSKDMLLSIEERNPDLGVAIRQKMFTFADLVRLEMPMLQRILREVDLRDLALALKTASDALKEKLLGCVSKRAAETVREEITFMGPVRLQDIELAQQRIIESVRKLEADGEVDLNSAREKGAYAMV